MKNLLITNSIEVSPFGIATITEKDGLAVKVGTQPETGDLIMWIDTNGNPIYVGWFCLANERIDYSQSDFEFDCETFCQSDITTALNAEFRRQGLDLYVED